jgi:hypothetical protein
MIVFLAIIAEYVEKWLWMRQLDDEGRNVRVLTSGIMSSMAKITPPIGVLNVAAIPSHARRAKRSE